MAKNKRDDGRYQKNIIVGRKANGSYIRKTIYGKTKKELELKIIEITQQIHQGIYVPEDKTTFGEMSEIWLTQYNPTANEKWIYRQKGVINKHLLPTLKYMKLKDLKPYHLQSIINQMAKDGLSTSTMKKAKQTAVRILNIGVENDLVVRNVFANVKVPTVEPHERRALTEEERDLVNRTWRGHRMGHAVMIMMYCGLRRGELLALTWEDIDLDKKILSVNKSVMTIKNQPQVKKPKSKVVSDIICALASGQTSGQSWGNSLRKFARKLGMGTSRVPAISSCLEQLPALSEPTGRRKRRFPHKGKSSGY